MSALEDLKNHLSQALAIIQSFETVEEEPDRPSKAEYAKEPNFETTSITMPSQWSRPKGGPEGLIVHYSASRVDAGLAVMKYGAGQGYYYLVIDHDGKILVPAGHNWSRGGYHAGTSKFPDGSGNVSMRAVGIEISNPGILTSGGDYCYPWYNKTRSATEERFLKKDCRYTGGEANQTKGWYLPYTMEQERSLVILCHWLKTAFSCFSYDLVLGHDEVSPGRKQDPGAALSMTMPKFREFLKSGQYL